MAAASPWLFRRIAYFLLPLFYQNFRINIKGQLAHRMEVFS